MEKDQKTKDLELIEKLMTGKGMSDSSGICREGEKIIVPQNISLKDAASTLIRISEEEEQMKSVQSRLKGFPFDGAYALTRAVKEVVGYTIFEGEKNPSGSKPPKSIKIEVPNKVTGEFEMKEIPWGKIALPSMGNDDGDAYLETHYDSSSFEFVVSGQLKKRFSPVFDLIIAKTKYYLNNESIYQGQAIKVDLSFIDEGGDPIQPEFMKIPSSIKDDIIINDVEAKLYSQVLYRITNTSDCIARKLPIKTGVLLCGK